MQKRSVFYVSDSTGITAETMGHSLLAQFDGIDFEETVLPFVDTPERAQAAVDRINQAAVRDGAPPIIFDTIVDHQIRAVIATSNGLLLDIFSTYLNRLEQALGTKSNYAVGRPHTPGAEQLYQRRIEAVNYALENDDGARINRYDQAQLILVGVSRSGKTPTCLYLAMQHGVFAANYPLTEEDLETGQLPKALQPHRQKLYGLTIEPERLAAIRNERRANSRYASLSQCEDEVRMALALLQRNQIRYIDSTHTSIEEIAAKILADTGLRERRH
jgi:regulator of PEP synthase PpsR (kinase-PPPase family)